MYILSLPKKIDTELAELATMLGKKKYGGTEVHIDQKLDDDLFVLEIVEAVKNDDDDIDHFITVSGSWFKEVEDKKETNEKRALVFDGDEWSVIGELDDRDRDIIAGIIGTVSPTSWTQINLHIGILTQLVEEDD